MVAGSCGCTVIAITCTGSGSPSVSCSQRPSPSRRKIPLSEPAVNAPAPTNTRDSVVMRWLLAFAQLRVPGVSESITEEVESEDRDADGETGEDGQPRRLLHEGSAGAAQHQPPRRRRRLRADAEEAQRRLDE